MTFTVTEPAAFRKKKGSLSEKIYDELSYMVVSDPPAGSKKITNIYVNEAGETVVVPAT